MGELWTPEEEARLRERPYDYAYFNEINPNARTKKAFQIKRGMLGLSTEGVPVAKNESVVWDKKASDVSWRDFITALDPIQALRARSGRSQDYAHIHIATDRPVPLAFISDWHIGSWGVDAQDIARGTDKLLELHARYGLHVAILGDMVEMAIRLRSIAEISGNLLPPSDQIAFFRSWLRDVSELVLWATWDNHAVIREEELVGHSAIAEICKDYTIYHSGIGHTDLEVGDQVYSLATSHRFAGRSVSNPVAGQMRYMQNNPDREVVVAGDSHRPAIMQYEDGGKERVAANCGSLQTNSRYAKRHFSLHTSEAMPVILFSPDEHTIAPHYSLSHFERFARRYL